MTNAPAPRAAQRTPTAYTLSLAGTLLIGVVAGYGAGHNTATAASNLPPCKMTPEQQAAHDKFNAGGPYKNTAPDREPHVGIFK